MDVIITIPDKNVGILKKFLKQQIKNHKSSNRYIDSKDGKDSWNIKELSERKITNNLMIGIYQPIVDQIENQMVSE